MERDILLKQIRTLRQQDKSIRAIASQLKVHPSKVQRVVAKLSQREVHKPVQKDVFVGRERELAELRDALYETMLSRSRLVMLTGEPDFGTPTSRAKGLPIKIL